MKIANQTNENEFFNSLLGEVPRGSGREGVVGSTTRPPRPLPDPLRVGGEADIVRISCRIKPRSFGQSKVTKSAEGEVAALLAAQQSSIRESDLFISPG